MKNKLRFSVFLFIPIVLFLTSCSLKDNQGPYFANYQYDPSYVYLISSLNLSQFSSIKHVDHPGTPLQVIGAAVVILSYYFNRTNDSIAQEVLLNPEKYLSHIVYTLMTINCFGLFLLGVISYKMYSDIFLSILLQLTPFTSINIISSFTLVRPENFLFFVVCIFIAGLLYAVNVKNTGNKKYPLHVIFLGIVCGLGLATKLTFFPLILIPLMLFTGARIRLLFIMVLVFSFIIFVLPAITLKNINYFINWVYKLFVHSKIYGKGEPNIVDTDAFIINLGKVFTTEWIFTMAYFSVCISIILWLKKSYEVVFHKFRNAFKNVYKNKLSEWKANFRNMKFKLAFGILLCMTLQILIVSKHYAPHYMFPSLSISVFAIITSILFLSYLSEKNLSTKILNISYLLIIFSITVSSIIFINDYKSRLRTAAEESAKLVDYVENNSDNSVIVSTKLVSSIETALFAGTIYAKNEVNNYKLILNDKYPQSIIFFNGRCYSFSDDDKIELVFKGADKILLACTEDISINPFLELLQNIYHIVDISIEKKFTNMNGEMVYEINFRHS